MLAIYATFRMLAKYAALSSTTHWNFGFYVISSAVIKVGDICR